MKIKIIPYLRYPLAKKCKKPSFLIIGAQKSGTTSLLNYLSQHPNILGSVIRGEVHYFDLNYNKKERWYLSHFPFFSKDKIVFEKSPYYLYHPLVPERCYNFDKNLKLIILLRDPVKRAYSHFHHEIRNGRENRSFRRAIEEEIEKVEKDHRCLRSGSVEYSYAHQRYSYLSRGRYVEQIDAWTEFFPRKQIYINTAEQFFKDPQKACNDIFSFLELPSIRIYSKRRHNTGNYSPIEKKDKEWLSKEFNSFNARLSKKYGIDTSSWC